MQNSLLKIKESPHVADQFRNLLAKQDAKETDAAHAHRLAL